jgi:hypothetical protein
VVSTRGNLEPEARLVGAQSAGGPDDTLTQACIVSLAISLKRIADALNEPNAYGEVGSAALSGAILRGLRGQS